MNFRNFYFFSFHPKEDTNTYNFCAGRPLGVEKWIYPEFLKISIFFQIFFSFFFQMSSSKTMLHESFKHENIRCLSGGCFTPPACTKIKNSSCVTVKYGGWVGGSLVFGRWLREDPRTSDFFSIDTGGLNQTTILKIKRIFIVTEPEGHQ